MASFSLTVFLVATAVVCVYGQTYKVTTAATDYFRLSQRDLLNDCNAAEAQIDAVNLRYADQLQVIQIQQSNILTEIRNVNKTYTQQQALSLRKKYCIQKNVLQLVTFDSASDRLDTCYKAASAVGTGLTKSASADLTYARNVPLTSLPKSIATCDANNKSNQTKLEECYAKEVDQATINTNYYLTDLQSELDKSLFTANVAITTAVKCSFAVEDDVLTKLGKTQLIMADCEANFDEYDMRSEATQVQQKQAPVPTTLKKLIGE